MTPQRWARLKDLFEAALERPPGERGTLLAHLCSGDDTLLREVQSLIENLELVGETADNLPLFSPGQVLSGRYEILAFLGRGGMAEVYEAEDRDLHARVAIKAMLRRFALDSSAPGQLLNELRTARRVTHPNVCRVFDFGRHSGPNGDVLFITMELLAGETLAQFLRRTGPLPLRAGLDLARQIASALDTAHEVGVIHRDLKSANIMLVQNGSSFRAAVMDFGLAIATFPASSSVMSTSAIAGTPAYMAPELLNGIEPTRASDIYAFAVVVHEIITGRKPSEVAAGSLPTLVENAVRRCLAHDPASRLPTATALVEAAEPTHNNALSVSTRRIFLMAAVLSACVALALFVFRYYFRKPLTASGSVLLVTDVVNSTGDPDLDTMTLMLRNQLAQSAYIDVWDPARLPPLLKQMAQPVQPLRGNLAREVALREGVPLLLFASLSPVADGLVLNLKLEERQAHSAWPRRSWDYAFNARSKSAIYDVVHEASSWLRNTVGESASAIAQQDRPPEDITTSSWQALLLYAQAETARQNGRNGEAIALLKAALEQDSNFALAAMRLGDILMSARRQAEGLRYWQSAIQTAQSRRLTRREELRIAGLYAAETQNYATAEAAFSRMESEYPRDYIASFYLGDALRWQGRLAEALEKMQMAEKKNPESQPVRSNLAGILLLLGRDQDLEKAAAGLVALQRPDTAQHYLGLSRFARGDESGALECFRLEAASTQESTHRRGQLSTAFVLCELGRYQEARELLSTEMDSRTQPPEARAACLLYLAYIDFRTGSRAAVRSRALEALTLDSGPFVLRRAGVLLARTGFPADARNVLRFLDVLPSGTPLVVALRARIEGELQLAAKRTTQALNTFALADRAEPALRPREYLARALLEAGQPANAIPLLKYIADSPQLLWQMVDFDFPGEITDSLELLHQAATRAGDSTLARTSLERYHRRRALRVPSHHRGTLL